MGHVSLKLNVYSNIRSPLAVTISDHLMHNPLAFLSLKSEVFFHRFLIIPSVEWRPPLLQQIMSLLQAFIRCHEKVALDLRWRFTLSVLATILILDFRRTRSSYLPHMNVVQQEPYLTSALFFNILSLIRKKEKKQVFRSPRCLGVLHFTFYSIWTSSQRSLCTLSIVSVIHRVVG
jgi:hypothetical protein